MPDTKYQQSLYIPVSSIDGITHQLHLNHLWNNEADPVVVMFHGIIENGRIFYKGKEKGLANFLVGHGYNVYVVDFRGRGLSKPGVKEHNNFGQFETITEDIPAVAAYITEKYQSPFHVICHSYGGVLFSSSWVRHAGFDGQIKSLSCFGTKRQVKAPTFERRLKVDLIWNRLVPLIAARKGYFDAKRFRFGDDSESSSFINQSVFWIKNDHWIDPVDDYDYEAQAKKLNWPPTLYFSAKKDYSLGHHLDVERFIQECHIPNCQHTFLAKSAGNLEDYDHINMLTHPSAVYDHFPMLEKWLREC